MSDHPDQLTDLHMLVLATLTAETVICAADVTAAVGLPVSLVRTLLLDLEAAGFIESSTLH